MSTDMKQNTRGVAICSIIGGVVFFSLAMPVSLTFMLNMEIASIENSLTVDILFLLITTIIEVVISVVGVIIGGRIGKYIEKNKSSSVPFKNTTISIVFWSIASFGLLGLSVGAWFSGVTLIGLGNRSTAIDLWIFSGIVMIIGVIAGAVIGILIALIRFTINKIYALSNRAQ